MSYATDPIAKALKEAREAKAMSQRELSANTGVPQSHISKIERNGVDLRLSSLIALAHGVGLDLVLVPRQALPAVRVILQSARGQPEKANRPAYRLDEDEDEDDG
ncbi:helix-turn-helix domain-containing protein [Rhodospirillum rubrum]|uniref:Transcriptional regulator, XRE family n=1 Tax=Rhodospirillum rubrum (strain ATCC 11170 / ATH 1.1.1 / DSM 467 / LMG 4362 / NCIMB 8255 / S1) TaxID=269796 RepID=Q2RVB9_RHORT|nr:helix-turn-helix transcriptional regulator [Rhodospirillum rubrum]ABC21926.1 transcriptional regulator, XRE family [Rhodospirillum rubrum ATCC 11170]AEO47629.1 XRE family transcriptional regulator [Rhodospirillum rubrum F11]MBK5953493.1 transcriptional regulator [Rhodospirillum rubrum]QXG81583.1 helix-turn-helix domain-containing protein [Rhodospirillum rubrum]HAQ00471.1 XRE family transcriptional regulator [Rhodospirillum rubrum]